MKSGWAYLFFLIALLLVWRCTKPYLPTEVTTDYGYLVVEGVINPGSDSTIIKLSRTVKLSAKTTTRAELKATVTVQSDQNISYPLKETTNGNYASAGLNLDITKKYRLSIKTLNGKSYMSDFVVVKNSPVIDSVGYTIGDDGLSIYNNAHDATNNTKYYRWEYQETWQYQADYQSKYISDLLANPKGIGLSVVLRTPAQQIFTCWGNANSSAIILGSTAKLTEDAIAHNVLTTVASNSDKLAIKYSILVKQYALTSDAYNYWALMKKNTEQLGSIFDAQPTLLKGNIYNIADTNEPVIGYMSVGTIQTKRVFISKQNLPLTWSATSTIGCVTGALDTAFFSDPRTGLNDVKLTLVPNPPLAIAIDLVYDKSGKLIGLSRADLICADCTFKGGVNIKPAFWP